ncbi:MAG: hypothetical protein M3480_04230 [Verrucomicrobiota bacterium]|nr:hypothetical protein [Chthoniobacterales bacterium]MDQ3414171.1 hypothetical protein [Verrucomicrobiota bacterium]
MESTANQHWFLCKHEDGSIFGPLPFSQVRRWAATAQVAPHDKLSHDQQTWLKAPMFPELEMDWLVEVTNDRYYGPTTLGAVQEFLRLGEIGDETFVINSCDGSRRQIRELRDLFPWASAVDEEALEEAPATTTMAINLRNRISDLEQSLFEERRALQECEERYRKLEERYREREARYHPQ